jgi:hypothetical protein
MLTAAEARGKALKYKTLIFYLISHSYSVTLLSPNFSILLYR